MSGKYFPPIGFAMGVLLLGPNSHPSNPATGGAAPFRLGAKLGQPACPSFNSKYNRRTSRVLRMDTRFPGTVTSSSEVTLLVVWCPVPPNSFPQPVPDHPDHPSCNPRSLIGFAQEW